jgi:hypothetical protein
MNGFEDMIREMRDKPAKPIPPELGTVDQMIALARQHAESCLVGQAGAELLPAWCVLTERGHSLIVATPFIGEDSKQMVADAMRYLMSETGAVRYSFATEAWMAKGEAPDGRPPAQREDRVEAVMIIGCDRGESKMASFEIVRGGGDQSRQHATDR